MVRALVIGLAGWTAVSCLAGVVLGQALRFCARHDGLAMCHVDESVSDRASRDLQPAA